jgi:hypothetical protein
MKKWTVQLAVLLVLTGGIILASRLVVTQSQKAARQSGMVQKNMEHLKGSVSIPSLGRHLLDVLK